MHSKFISAQEQTNLSSLVWPSNEIYHIWSVLWVKIKQDSFSHAHMAEKIRFLMMSGGK